MSFSSQAAEDNEAAAVCFADGLAETLGRLSNAR